MNAGKESALLFAVLFLPGMLGQSVGVDPTSFDHIAYHVQVLAIAVPQILLVVAVSNGRIPGSAARFGWRRPVTRDLIVAALGLVLTYLVAVLLGAVASLLANPGMMQSTVAWSFSRYEVLPLVMISTLAIGYREEIFFRAYLADRAPELGVHPRTALYAGALIFGLGHIYQGPGGFLLATVLGAVFAEIYLRTRSLHGIAVAHGMFNLIALLQAGPA